MQQALLHLTDFMERSMCALGEKKGSNKTGGFLVLLGIIQ